METYYYEREVEGLEMWPGAGHGRVQANSLEEAMKLIGSTEDLLVVYIEKDNKEMEILWEV